MQDNLTTDMHGEFIIDAETIIKHKAACVWSLLDDNYSHEQLERYCSIYGITLAQALKWKAIR